MTLLPFTEILLFIALFFAPEGTTTIELTDPSGETITFTQTEAGWHSDAQNLAYPDAHWLLRGETLYRNGQPMDLDQYVAGATTHDWCAESILTVHQEMQVLKTADGLTLYPD
ncbi:MAG: hypothetical protein ACLFU2_11585, partial [Opitutales bacterium]